MRILKIDRRWTVSVLAIALLASSGAGAQEETDSDGDGFSDAAENAGLVLAEGLTMTTADGRELNFVPSCIESELPRSECLDPASPDLFLVLAAASPSSLPANPFAPTIGSPTEGGLGLGIHPLSEDPAIATGDRIVSPGTSPQKAVRITESLSTPGDKLGFANYGTPNGLDGSTIYTERIRAFVAGACETDALCQTSRGETGIAAVSDALARYVLNHELGHLFSLTAQYNKRFGGYHVKSGEDEMLSQFADYDTSKRSGVTTFNIPETFSDQSRADRRLQ